MILIIAEKPSLGRNIAAGIEEAAGNGARLVKKSGYLEGCGYLVTWAFGHLFSLADIEDYDEKSAEKAGEKRRWTMEGLPCFPEKFRFSLRSGDDGIARQFRVIETLCNRDDVDTVVNAGDADREGEVIVRLCVQNALHTKKRLCRLWLPDQTPKTVAAALADMKEETEYDNLANEGFARTYIDWLYGVNLTRYATLKCGTLLRVGRVIVPIVKAIYDRDMAIRNFKPEIYYAIVGKTEWKGESVEITSREKFSANEKAKAEAYCRALNEMTCRVTDKKTKKETLAPGKLYSLSKLQNVLGKKYKMPMDESLSIVQKLYEEGYLTYPRTNSEYLATAEQGKVKEILGAIGKMGYPVEFRFHKSIFDDSKIESHSALTPTYKIPDKSRLTDKEMQVYSAVFRRFVAVFCAKPCKVAKTEIKLQLENGEEFTLKGTTVLEEGWLAYDDGTVKDKFLPPLEVGDELRFSFAPIEKETSPPRHYTIETLNNYLKNPFREDRAKQKEQEKADSTDGAESDTPEDDQEDYRAIFEGLELGTEATRTGIIDNARKSGYIELKKDVYSILPGGIYLIESLSQMQIAMDKYKTSELGQALKRVYRGKMTVEESVRMAEREIDLVFHPVSKGDGEDFDSGFFGDSVGKCPLCGNEVVRGRYNYGCRAYKECKFRIPLTLCSRVIPIGAARALLRGEKTELLRGFISKKGNPFDASLVLEGERTSFVFEERADRPKRAETVYAREADPSEAPLPDEPPAWLTESRYSGGRS